VLVSGEAGIGKSRLVRELAVVKRRVEVHARIAAALEASLPEVVNDRPDVLAHHHAEAEHLREALGYPQNAAAGALMRSANAEAVSYARQGLSFVGALESERERVEAEVGTRMPLVSALMSHHGFGHPEIATILDGVQALLDSIGGASVHAVPALMASQLYHHICARRRDARSIAVRTLALARRRKDTTLEIFRSWAGDRTDPQTGSWEHKRRRARHNARPRLQTTLFIRRTARTIAPPCRHRHGAEPRIDVVGCLTRALPSCRELL
jgi:hypothetical protein